jgi:hypothetical protein
VLGKPTADVKDLYEIGKVLGKGQVWSWVGRVAPGAAAPVTVAFRGGMDRSFGAVQAAASARLPG